MPARPVLSDQSRQFLSHLHRGAPWGYWFILPGETSSWWPTTKPAALPIGTVNIYFGVHPSAEQRGRKGRSTKESVAAINCLFAEFDAHDSGQKTQILDRLEQERNRPSVVIDSGGGYHAYWLLRDPFFLTTEEERQRAIHIQDAWVHIVGGDPGAKDLARMLRVPGTRNYKPKYAPDFPLVHFVWSEMDTLYNLDDLERWTTSRRPPKETRVAPHAHTPDKKLSSYIQTALAAEIEILVVSAEPGRNDQLNRSAFALGTLVGAGALDRETVETELQQAAMEIGLEETEIRRTIKSGLDSGIAEPRDLSSLSIPPILAARNNGKAQIPDDADDAPEFPVLESDPFPDPPDDTVYYGLAGDFCRITAPHTEADPVALLTQFLVYFGSAINRCAYFSVEADRHYTNESLVIVGKTGKARKGTSAGYVRRLFAQVDDWFTVARIKSGLSSGEGIIYHVRDKVTEEQVIKEKDGGGTQEVVIDPGVEDKRLLVEEGEFASVLKVMGREGNTLSPVLRMAWDGRPLEALTKNSRVKSERPHISIVGHCTRDELKKHLTETEYANGFGNRFLWICVQRSKILPEGGKYYDENMDSVVHRIIQAVLFARRTTEIKRDEEAAQYWRDIYPDLSADLPGMLGAITARAEAHTMRLALLYAVIDCSPVIRIEHLDAAYNLWRYAFRSAQHIFGTEIGDSVADHIHAALKKAPEGMTQTAINDMFGGHKSPDTIARALATLRRLEIIIAEKIATKRRPKTVWRINPHLCIINPQ